MKGEPTDWPAAARRLAEVFSRSALHPKACRRLDETEGRIGVACSGGADSLCLLLLLWAHFPDRRKDFLVLHFDHRLRGEASRGDARFVEEVARGLGLARRTGHWERAEREAVSEETARAARFRFFYEELRGGGESVGPLVLGHQREDVVENHLMRLSRGSGTGGLAAPRPVHEFRDGRVHVRPLLTVGGGEIRRALAEVGIPYRTDASNAGHGFYRNRIRLEVLPKWQEHSPFDVAAGAAASRELLEEDEEALVCWLRESMPEPVRGKPLDLRPLDGKPVALVRRALHEWLRSENVAENLSKRAFEQLLEAAVGKEAFKGSCGDGAFLRLTADGLLAKEEVHAPARQLFEEPWPLPFMGTIFLPGGKSLAARVRTLGSELRNRIVAGGVDSRGEAFVAWDGGPLSVRHWRAGDRVRLLGSPGSRKLQDIFVDLKIPEGERSLLPVVCVRSNILWSPCLAPAEAFKIKQLTKTVVQLTYDWSGAV